MDEKQKTNEVEISNQESGSEKQKNISKKPKTMLLGEEQAAPLPSFADQVYSKINDVLGGDSLNQFLCLTIPGQALSAEDFAYDYKNHAPKGPTIEANESRLANKLFDPAKMVGADNGLSLPYQYRSALDMLSPKLNAKVAEAKNQLRELLMTEYHYKFSDDDNGTYTLQEVFFRLYDEWVEAETEWARIQNEKQEELRKIYPGDTIESNIAFNDAYLTWYETEAESHLNAIDEKMSKVISVFTPNDMKILEGILDAGSGAELENARDVLNNTQKKTPTGGYVYPVKLNPTNWFEYLDTVFTPVDILDNPDVYIDKISKLSSRRAFVAARIEDLGKEIPNDKDIAAAQAKIDDAYNELREAKKGLVASYGEGITTIVETALNMAGYIAGLPDGKTAVIALLNSANFKGDIQKAAEDIMKCLETGTDAQQQYIAASQNLADAIANSAELKTKAELKKLFSPLNYQLDEIDSELESLNLKVKLSQAKSDGLTEDDNPKNTMIPEGFSQIYIEADSSSVDKESSSDSYSKVSTSGMNFWFCGYESESSEASSHFSDATSSESFSIQIGMNVAKVGIERDWFNPGVFTLTKDMFKVSTEQISQYPVPQYDDKGARINDLAKGNYIFPCYPTAMVVARDVSIKLEAESDFSSSFSEQVEEHASTGGGFLFFSGASSSSSSSSSSGVHSSCEGKTITLRFDTPQVIGYYMEITPPDKSVYLGEFDSEATEAGYVSITRFVEDYIRMLEEMKKKKAEREPIVEPESNLVYH